MQIWTSSVLKNEFYILCMWKNDIFCSARNIFLMCLTNVPNSHSENGKN